MTNRFFEKVLKKKDKDTGLGGNYLFSISVNMGGDWIPVIGILGLTEKASRILFDQFDEANVLFPDEKGNVFNFRIQIILDGKEIDLNYLPNVFSNA